MIMWCAVSLSSNFSLNAVNQHIRRDVSNLAQAGNANLLSGCSECQSASRCHRTTLFQPQWSMDFKQLVPLGCVFKHGSV